VAGLVWLQGGGPGRAATGGAAPETASESGPDAGGARQARAGGHAKRPKPHFEFYTILPDMEVQVPDQELDAAASRETKKASSAAESAGPTKGGQKAQAGTANEAGSTYVLQVGSFRHMQEADRLKASLALIGLQAGIQSVSGGNDDTWYRVRLGPYSDLKKLNAARDRLRENGMEAMVLKIKT